jgi:hypothetical protein
MYLDVLIAMRKMKVKQLRSKLKNRNNQHPERIPMKLLALALLLSPFTALASVDSCELPTVPLTADSRPARRCGIVESAAAKAAFRAGLQRDIDHVIALESDATCKQARTQAIRTQVEAGNHGNVVSVLLLTEVKCEGKFFVSSPLHRFPVLVKLWANHEETEVDATPGNYLEVKKLYELR